MPQQIDYSNFPQQVDYSDFPDPIDYSDFPEPVVEEEQGTLSKFIEWGTTPLLEKYPEISGMSPEERALLHPKVQSERTFAEYATAPFSLLGEAIGGAGAIAGLRKFTRLGKLGKAAGKVDDIPTTRPGIMNQKAPLGARPTIFPELPLAISPLQTELGSKLPSREILVDALKRQTVLNKQQQKIAASETARRFGEAGEVTTRGTAGAKEFMGKLAGKHPRLVTTPLDLNTSQIDNLHTIILDASLPETSKAKAIAGLSTIKEGGQAMASEVAVLDNIFGVEVGKAIRSKGIGRTRNRILESLGLVKALKSGLDASWMLRQGALHFMRPHWRKAFFPQLKALANEGYFAKTNEGILRSAKNIDYKKKMGLSYTDLKTFEGREEEVMSTWVENIPSIPSLLRAGISRDSSKLKPGLISAGFRASNRSFTLAGNLVRDGAFDVLYDDYGRYYRASKKIAEAIPSEKLKVKALKEAELFNPDNPYRGRKIADEANVSTGRGGLGKAEIFATELNTGLWSARLFTSRVRSINRVLNPISYIRQDPVMRKEHLKQLFSLIGLTTTTAGLTKMMGGETSLSPFSSDFLKGKIGRVRFDLLGGIPQYIVPVIKAAFNRGVSTETGRPYTLGEGITDDAIIVLVKALMYKEAPLPGFFTSLIRREDPIGRPLDLTSLNPYENKALNLFVPMITEDLFELVKEDPGLIPILMPLVALGGSVQVHEER